LGVTLYRLAAAVSQHQTGTTGPYELIGGSSLMLADELDYVLGVDTHRDERVIAVVTAPAGAVMRPRPVVVVIGSCLLSRGQHAPGRRVWAVEGSGSYGAGLARFLAERGETVLEISRAGAPQRRLKGKDDALDAARIARAALAATRSPRRGQVADGKRCGCS
jgi:Transposase